MFIFLLPILQAIAACCTIWGFANTPALTDTVVTYGATSDEAADAPLWINSVVSIAVGIGGMIITQWMKSKNGMKSEFYIAMMQYLGSPFSNINLLRVTFALLAIVEGRFVKTSDDAAAMKYIRDTLTHWMTQPPAPPPQQVQVQQPAIISGTSGYIQASIPAAPAIPPAQ